MSLNRASNLTYFRWHWFHIHFFQLFYGSEWVCQFLDKLFEKNLVFWTEWILWDNCRQVVRWCIIIHFTILCTWFLVWLRTFWLTRHLFLLFFLFFDFVTKSAFDFFLFFFLPSYFFVHTFLLLLFLSTNAVFLNLKLIMSFFDLPQFALLLFNFTLSL